MKWLCFRRSAAAICCGCVNNLLCRTLSPDQIFWIFHSFLTTLNIYCQSSLLLLHLLAAFSLCSTVLLINWTNSPWNQWQIDVPSVWRHIWPNMTLSLWTRLGCTFKNGKYWEIFPIEMQGPGGWVRLGFILNWKCLVSGVEAKPCIGHWDSCALPGGKHGVSAWDLDLQSWGAGSYWQPGCYELGLARIKGQEWAVLHIPLQTHKQDQEPELFREENIPFLGKKLSQLSSPAFPIPPFAATALIFMGQKQKCKEEHESVQCQGHHQGVGKARSWSRFLSPFILCEIASGNRL